MEQGISARTGRRASFGRTTIARAAALALLVTASFAEPAVAGKLKVVCGNNVAQASEACDGTDLRGKTCQSIGFAGGSLACAANCTFETTRCVSLPRYKDNGDGTVTDLSSGLQWEQKNAGDDVPDYTNPHDADNAYTWGNLPECPIVGCPNGTVFTDFLGRLNYNMTDKTTTYWPCFAGHCDWRLPTIFELATIMDFNSPTCGGGACVDPIFGPTGTTMGSSSTAIDQDPFSAYAWAVFSYTGFKNPIPKTSSVFQFRAVRHAD